jgi:hypothetical protein
MWSVGGQVEGEAERERQNMAAFATGAGMQSGNNDDKRGRARVQPKAAYANGNVTIDAVKLYQFASATYSS